MIEARLYKLDENHNPVPCNDVHEWALCRQERRIYDTYWDQSRISTVFLGLPHPSVNGDDSDAFFFETLVFGGPHDGTMYRYRTYAEAVDGHHRTLYLVSHGSLPDGR